MKYAYTIRRFLALVLTVCCLFSSTAFTFPVHAAKLNTITVPVVPEDGLEFMGRFLQGPVVYVELNTLLRMNREIGQYLTEDGKELVLYRNNNASVSYTSKHFVEHDGGIYVPFLLTMDRLYLNTIADKANQRLMVLDGIHLKNLESILTEIYEVPAYNMRYWKESKNYENDVELAEGLRALRNFDWVSFEKGKSSQKDYKDAFGRIIVPQENEDVEFAKETSKMVSLLSSFAGICKGAADDINMLFNTNENLLLDYRDSIEIADAMGKAKTIVQLDDSIEVISFFKSVQNAENSIIRGLELILPECKKIDNNMYKAGKSAMTTYEKGKPMWGDLKEDILSGTIEIAEDLLKDNAPHMYLFDLGNLLTDTLCNTGNQLDGVVMASRYLNIQDACINVFNDLHSDFRDTAGEIRTDLLQSMYDVTRVYLRAGLQAQRAMAVDSDMKKVTAYATSMLNKELDTLAEYPEFEIMLSANVADADDWLDNIESIENTDLQTPELFAKEDFGDMPVYVDITWDQDWTESHKINVLVEGVLDDGSQVVRAPTEGEYLSSSDYSHVGSHYIYNNGLTELKFYRLDALYNIVVTWDESYYFNNFNVLSNDPEYSYIDLNIRIYNPHETLLNIAADIEKAREDGREKLTQASDFLFRGNNGIWYYQLNLDHGKVKPGMALLPSQNTSEETKTDITYAPNGQIQSKDTYNALGYKISSEWFDNGTCTAYTYWDYNDQNQLLEIRYMNVMEPDEVTIRFVHTGSSVQMYNLAGTLLGEGPTAYDAAEQIQYGFIVAESMPK